MEETNNMKKLIVKRINKIDKKINFIKKLKILTTLLAGTNALIVAGTTCEMITLPDSNKLLNILKIFIFGGYFVLFSTSSRDCSEIKYLLQYEKEAAKDKLTLEENPTIEECEENKRHIVTKITKANEEIIGIEDSIDDHRVKGARSFAIAAILTLLLVNNNTPLIGTLLGVGMLGSTISTVMHLDELSYSLSNKKNLQEEKDLLEKDLESIERIRKRKEIETF